MNTELQNAIRLAICSGWISTITKPRQMPELVRSESPTSGGVTVHNCAFVDCGTAVQIEGGNMTMTGSHIQNCGIAFAASGDAHIDVSSTLIDECQIVFKETS